METAFVERHLTIPEGRTFQNLSVKIYVPARSGNAWECRFSVSGASEASGAGYGEDGLQALLNGIEAARQHVQQLHPDATWLSGTEGDVGFPIILQPMAPLSAAQFASWRQDTLDLMVQTFGAIRKSAGA